MKTVPFSLCLQTGHDREWGLEAARRGAGSEVEPTLLCGAVVQKPCPLGWRKMEKELGL